jgi:hypothetical protein
MSNSRASWGRGFDPDRLALLELKMWKAYYRRQPARLFALLVKANREQARASWPRAVLAAALLARAAAAFGKTGWEGPGNDPAFRDDPGYLRDIARGYRILGLPDGVDVTEVARRELRWWVARREIGMASGQAAGSAIAALYSELYGVPLSAVATAGRLRGQAAEFRDRGAAVDPEGPAASRTGYWPEVGRILVASYRSLKAAVAPEAIRAAAVDAAIEAGIEAVEASDLEEGSPDAKSGMDGGRRRGFVRPWGRLRRSRLGDRRGAKSNEYAFLTTWTIAGSPEEISSIIGDVRSLPRWWPSVYLAAEVAEPGDSLGIGRVVELHTKGWLPYTLRWRFTVTESDPPRGFSLRASGDFVGRGIWTLTPDQGDGTGPMSRVVYDWRVAAEKSLLRRLSFIAKPVFAANHRWAMARGEESLRLELARRHAAGDAAVLAAIPAPPQPTFRFLGGRKRPEVAPGQLGMEAAMSPYSIPTSAPPQPARRRWRLPIP